MVSFPLDCSSVEQLRNARSYASQSAALRALKNETVGHVLKKERCVEAGVLRPIVQVLLRARPAGWEDTAHAPDPGQPMSLWLVEPQLGDLSAKDEARLQALELLGIFAGGGPAFLAPLHAAGALQALLMYIHPHTIHTRLVYAALRALSTITKAAKLVDPSPSTETTGALSAGPSPTITLHVLADALFSTAPDDGPSSTVLALRQIISLTPQISWRTEAIANTAMALVGELCREPAHQAVLARAGLLDALANTLASYVVAQGLVVPGADLAAVKEGLRDVIPAPASPGLDMTAALSAIAAIVGDSRLHACLLLSMPPILAIFPQLTFESTVNDVQAAWRALSLGGLSNMSPNQPLGALDLLLPAVPSQQSRSFFASHSAAFPPLGMSLSRDNLPPLGRQTNYSGPYTGPYTGALKQRTTSSETSSFIWGHSGRPTPGGTGAGPAPLADGNDAEDAESPMVPWLINLVRSSSGLRRMAAASVLTSLYRTGFASKSRVAALALLVVPLLMQALEKASNSFAAQETDAGDDRARQEQEQEQQAVAEAALAVLARLVANSEVLQKAAVDCHALPVLSKLLKNSYVPVSTRNQARPWDPTPRGSTMASPLRAGTPDAGHAASGSSGRTSDSVLLAAAACRLGTNGQSPLLVHRIRLREGVLRVVTALIATKDEYKRAFVDQDVLAHVVASLSPTPARPHSPAKDKTGLPLAEVEYKDTVLDPEYGRNPVGVLVAACNCVRMLSRSIGVLRTDLEDADIAPSVFRLLKHADVDVRTAATALLCNLVTETSPMRKRFTEAGVMNILCGHAHSENSALRLNAMWALKHFVDGAELSVKKACLEQLGSGWLLHLIGADGNEDAAPTHFARGQDSGSDSSRGVVLQPSAPSDDVEMDRSEDEEDGGIDGDDAGQGRREDGYGDETEDQGEGQGAEGGGGGPGGGDYDETGRGGAGTAATPSRFLGRGPAAAPQQTSHERSRTGRLRAAAAKVSLLREQERKAPRKGLLDDAVIQEQGLNFVRNLIGPGPYSSSDPSIHGTAAAASTAAGGTQSSSATVARDTSHEATEMIDYLFGEVGEERLFRLLLAKLLAVSVPGAAGALPAQQQVKIVEAVVFILVHVSASVPRHKQVVVAQTEVLRALVEQFGSRDKGVRVALCHLMTNLTWCDETTDRAAAAARTIELKRLGLLTKLQQLQQEDADLEVKEQAKMVLDQMGGAPHGSF